MTKDELLLQRRRKGLTQAELATAIGYSRQAVIKWERGIHAIPDGVASQIIEACQDIVPSRLEANNAAAVTKRTVDAYRKMRANPGEGGTHAAIVRFWFEHGFTPSEEVQIAILAEWPDILPKQED